MKKAQKPKIKPVVRSKDDMTPDTLMDVSREKVRIQIAGNMMTVLPIITASLQRQIYTKRYEGSVALL